MSTTDNVIHPAAFAGKPVVVNPARKGGHATRLKGVIGLRHRRQLRQDAEKREAEKRAEEAEARRIRPQVVDLTKRLCATLGDLTLTNLETVTSMVEDLARKSRRY